MDPVGKTPRDPREDHRIIAALSERMADKMEKNRHKAHWNTVSQAWLFSRLEEELTELEQALMLGGDVESECADVANFAAMIADNWRK